MRIENLNDLAKAVSTENKERLKADVCSWIDFVCELPETHKVMSHHIDWKDDGITGVTGINLEFKEYEQGEYGEVSYGDNEKKTITNYAVVNTESGKSMQIMELDGESIYVTIENADPMKAKSLEFHLDFKSSALFVTLATPFLMNRGGIESFVSDIDAASCSLLTKT